MPYVRVNGGKLHITLTGVYAGTPICGIEKRLARERGDEFAHMPYEETVFLAHPNLCPNCRHAWLSCDIEEELK